MRVLAIETASEACSVALFQGDACIAHRHEVLGRGHAERLVPMIAELPERGRAEHILVSLGPGSFTGIRIGLATARALAVAWSSEVSGYPTLELVACMAREQDHAATTVCMNGGHGQWFVQNFDARGRPEDEVRSLTPEAAALAARHPVLVGNRAQDLAARLAGETRVRPLLPDARATRLLDSASLTADLAPVYGRPPDAMAKDRR